MVPLGLDICSSGSGPRKQNRRRLHVGEDAPEERYYLRANRELGGQQMEEPQPSTNVFTSMLSESSTTKFNCLAAPVI